MQEQAEKFGQSVLDKYLCQIQDKWDKTERKIHQADSYVLIPHLVFYILIIILVALSSFFASIIVANAEVLLSAVIWKIVACCTFMAVLGIVCAVVIPKLLNKLK